MYEAVYHNPMNEYVLELNMPRQLHTRDALQPMMRDCGVSVSQVFSATIGEGLLLLVSSDKPELELSPIKDALQTHWRARIVPDTFNTDLNPSVVVIREFASPVDIDEIQAQEDSGQWCLDTHGVTFSHTFFSASGKRMLCFYQAADAESVRISQRQINMPVADVWSGRFL